MQPKPFSLPAGFMFGSATAGAQIEGGDRNSSWYRWSHIPGKIKDNTTCAVADDHWNRVDEDIRLMKKMNLTVYRMGVEWSRIEPDRDSFDAAAMAHYRDEIIKLKKAGIKPLVTLHHFANPLWIEDETPWTDRRVIERFTRYASHVARELGDLVNCWVTINEPNVYLTSGYVFGNWPPGTFTLTGFLRAARNMIGAHISAYRAIHRIRKELGFHDTSVGVAHHLRVFEPATSRPGDRITAFLYERLFHEIFVTGMATGKLLAPLGFGHPFGKGDFQDFFGVNYYSRDIIAFNPANPVRMTGVKEGAPVNDLGWEIFPEGLYKICARYFKRFGKPLFITENGTCDAADDFRARFIYDHLYQVKRLIDDGIDVRRYYHWTLMDNFEWAEGLSAPFGLAAVNFKNQKRTLRASGKFYGEIADNRGVTAAMIKKFL